MAITWFRKLTKRRPAPGRARPHSFRPRLEDRIAPAVVVWDGGGADNNWTTAANWVGDTAPTAGNELVFHHGTPGLDLTSLTNTNDFAAGTSFSSFQFYGAPPAGQRFVLGGNAVSLGAAGIISQTAAGTDQINLPLHLPATTNIRIDTIGPVGSTFSIEGAITGPGGFVKRGTSALSLRGNQANSYTGATTVNDGTLILDKAVLNGAIPAGSLAIGDADAAIESVILARDAQIGNSVSLFVHATGELGLAPQVSDIVDALHGEGNVFINSGALLVGAGGGSGTFLGILHGTGSFQKRGSGEQVLGGTASNLFSGELRVEGGRLVLGKGTGASAFLGSTVVVGGPSAATLALAGSNQIPDSAVVFVTEASAVFDLNNRQETINILTVVDGNVINTGATGTSSLVVNTLNLNRGTVNIGGGGLGVLGNVHTNAASASATIGGVVNLLGGTRTFDVEEGAAPSDLILTGQIVGGSLTKTGAGRLVLAGNSPGYAGTTTVNGGGLQVNGSIAGSPVVVNSAGTLLGAGTVGPTTVNGGGRVSPGTSGIGVLTVQGNLRLNPGSVFQVDLRNGPGVADSDQLDVRGTVSLGGATLEATVAGQFEAGAVLTVINNDLSEGVSGTFAQGSQITVDGQQFNIDYGVPLGAPNDVRLIYTNTAPRFPGRAVTPVLDEGGVAVLTGTIFEPDPRDRFILDINWGDGTRTETHVFPAATPRDVRLTHRYLESGDYTIQLSWRDQHGAGNSGTLTTIVRNVAPLVDAGDDAEVRQGVPFVRVGSFSDPGVRDTWTGTVDFGDGSGPQALDLIGADRFLLRHRYAVPGRYLVTVIVSDDDGDLGTDSFWVTVL